MMRFFTGRGGPAGLALSSALLGMAVALSGCSGGAVEPASEGPLPFDPMSENAGSDPVDGAEEAPAPGTSQNEPGNTEGNPDPMLVEADPNPNPAPTTPPPGLMPGPGFFIGETCFAPCDSDASDADAMGVTDGFGFERGQSCVVPGSESAARGLPCVPGLSEMGGGGYLVGELCVPACSAARLADEQGYGFEALQTCVVEGSPAATQAARCPILPREGLPEPGDGFQLPAGCFPRCVNAAGDAGGFGFEQERTCVVAGSDAAVQGVPCVPAPADVIGLCPPPPIVCPVANGVTLECGCGFRQGFAEQKQVIMNTPGASQYFLASAMMETTTLTAAYPLGDVFPNGAQKTGDAFNGGIAKQNWGMMRRCHPEWSGLGAGDFLTGAELNLDLALDIEVYDECRQVFGNDWWSGHRLGFNNLGNNDPDVQRFRAAMDWTNLMLEGHLADDVFFYVVVPAI